MKKFALTGGIACGKSLAARFLNELGVETLDADDIVHEIIPDPAERRRIAAEVFSDPIKRRELESRIHPLVRRRIHDWLEVPRSKEEPLRVAVIPLLYETGWETDFDFVGCIVSSRELQIARMMEYRGYSREEAVARIEAQLSTEEKAARADFVIANDSTEDNLRNQVALFVDELRSRTL
jgi:dephospho-CoA kinase